MPTEMFVGAYRLTSYAGLSVPTVRYGVSCFYKGSNVAGALCSNPAQGCCFTQDIASGQLTLRADRTYSLVLTQADGTPVPEIGFLYPGLPNGSWGWRYVASNENILFLNPSPSTTTVYCCAGVPIPEVDAFATGGLTSNRIPFDAAFYEAMTFVR